MSMFGSLAKDYEAWKESAAERGLSSAVADDYEHIIREAFMAGAACIIGGAAEVDYKDGAFAVKPFLASYRDQVNRVLAELGVSRQ